MATEFEAWARSELVRLRAEADLLERLLMRFDSAAGRSLPRRVSVPGTRRNAPLMTAIASAGDKGLSAAEVLRAATAAGFATSKGAVRSFLWNQVRAGRLVATPAGSYAVPGEPVGKLNPNGSPEAAVGDAA